VKSEKISKRFASRGFSVPTLLHKQHAAVVSACIGLLDKLAARFYSAFCKQLTCSSG